MVIQPFVFITYFETARFISAVVSYKLLNALLIRSSPFAE